MKNYLRRARRAVVRDYDTELYATGAKEKAISCLSMGIRPRNSKVRSHGNARVLRKIAGISAEHLAALFKASG